MAKKTTKTVEKKPPHRPKIMVDWETVDKLCLFHCTGNEIAAFLGINYVTLERRCKEEKKIPLVEYLQEKRALGNISIRRKQMREAMDGNTSLLIWLGKNMLGQSDKAEVSVKKEITLTALPLEKQVKLLDEV